MRGPRAPHRRRKTDSICNSHPVMTREFRRESVANYLYLGQPHKCSAEMRSRLSSMANPVQSVYAIRPVFLTLAMPLMPPKEATVARSGHPSVGGCYRPTA